MVCNYTGTQDARCSSVTENHYYTLCVHRLIRSSSDDLVKSN